MPAAFASPLSRNGAFVRLRAEPTISILGSLITPRALTSVALQPGGGRRADEQPGPGSS